MALLVAKGDVLDSKGYCFGFAIPGFGVFPNSDEEIEGNVDEVCLGSMLR